MRHRVLSITRLGGLLLAFLASASATAADAPPPKLHVFFLGDDGHHRREETIREIELVKGPDDTAPIVVAVTVETR